jgi:hypothetical protein
LREYESLSPDERELRLKATELRWYLMPLMHTPGTNRAAQLALIPEEDRKLVQERIQIWDILPPGVQEELLDQDMTVRYFTRLESSTEEQRQNILNQISPERRAKLEAGIQRWRGLSEENRQKLLAGFNDFFELTPAEKEKALRTLSDAERRQMERTLASFEKLPREQRIACARSFEKFTGMSLAERQQFLQNAERWRLMSPNERQAWRMLVQNVQHLPPLPPGFSPPSLPTLQPVKTNRP